MLLSSPSGLRASLFSGSGPQEGICRGSGERNHVSAGKEPRARGPGTRGGVPGDPPLLEQGIESSSVRAAGVAEKTRIESGEADPGLLHAAFGEIIGFGSFY